MAAAMASVGRRSARYESHLRVRRTRRFSRSSDKANEKGGKKREREDGRGRVRRRNLRVILTITELVSFRRDKVNRRAAWKLGSLRPGITEDASAR